MSYTDIELASFSKTLREEAKLDQLTPIENIYDVIEILGHEIAQEKFGDDFSAVCMTKDGIKFNIILNSDQMWNENFRRFTIAHELGHVSLLEHHAEMMRNGGILKSKTEFQSNNIIEKEADKFAINFLAPRPLVLNLIKNLEFDVDSLSILCEKLGISLLAGAFRFIRLTDLCCSLMVIDNETEKIKYDFRSEEMSRINKHSSLKGEEIPYQGTLSKFLFSNSITKEGDVELNDYYFKMRRSLKCKESFQKMSYNNTTLVLLSVLDDPEDLLNNS